MMIYVFDRNMAEYEREAYSGDYFLNGGDIYANPYRFVDAEQAFASPEAAEKWLSEQVDTWRRTNSCPGDKLLPYARKVSSDTFRVWNGLTGWELWTLLEVPVIS